MDESMCESFSIYISNSNEYTMQCKNWIELTTNCLTGFQLRKSSLLFWVSLTPVGSFNC
jgi:hypothetical protein